MQAFEYRRDNNIVGLLHYPHTGELLNKQYMEILNQQYMQNNSVIGSLSEIERSIVSKMYVGKEGEDGKYLFGNLTEEEENNLESALYNIVQVYYNKLTEQIIVPQNMDSGPSIRHRPLYFGIGEDKKSIIVKYTTFGDFNNFNVALSQLGRIY